jgi:hypothetical protein
VLRKDHISSNVASTTTYLQQKVVRNQDTANRFLGLRKALSDLGNSVLTIHCGETGQKMRCRIRGMLILWLIRVEISGLCFWRSSR